MESCDIGVWDHVQGAWDQTWSHVISGFHFCWYRYKRVLMEIETKLKDSIMFIQYNRVTLLIVNLLVSLRGGFFRSWIGLIPSRRTEVKDC